MRCLSKAQGGRLKGEIQYSVQTFMGARLLAHISDAGICVIDVSMPDDHTLNVWISERDKKAFLKLMDSFHLPCACGCVRGRAKIRKSLKAHGILLAGLIAGVMTIYLLSLRVLVIDIQNPPEAIGETLDRLSISEGIRKSDVDVNALSRQLEAAYPDYAHIGVRLSGVVLKINCVKAESPPGVYDIGDARNLVAKMDGVVQNIDVFAGTALVKPGDAVFKGDILILGQERAGKDGSVTYVRAEGKVTARIWTKGESAASMNFSKNVPTGRTSVVTKIKTPFFEKTLSGENAFSLFETEESQTELIGLFLPVKLIKTTYIEMKEESFFIEKDKAQTIAFENALLNALQKAPIGAKETRRWAEYKNQDENTVACTAIVEWTMDICEGAQGG